MATGHRTVSRDEVARAVRAQLGESAELDTWTVVELGRGRGNATTSLGVARVSGTARINGVTTGWSQIRKIFVPATDVAGIDMGRSIEHWNYWRREPLLMASGHLRRLPAGVAAPTAYDVAENGSDVIVWMEDLGDLTAPDWTGDNLGLVARRLGELGGWFAGRAPAESWLSTDLLGQWVRDLPAMTVPLRGPGAPGWDHPVARGVFPNGAASPVARLLDDASSRLAALAASPTTFCHRDTGLDNLLLRGDPDQLVLFDWALAGTGPIGEDLGVLLASAIRHVPADPVELRHLLFDQYLIGLADARAPVNPTAVWHAAVVTAALRECIFAAFHVARGIEEPGAGVDTVAGLARDAGAIETLAEAALSGHGPRRLRRRHGPRHRPAPA